MGQLIVIGGANVDICGASNEPLRNYDSNPGTISVAFGGVGRNIAEYAALLDEKVKFVTAFSSDNYGTLLRNDCEQLGMDCSLSITTHDYPSSMYIAILDHDRDMRIAMSDMRILRAFTKEMLDDVLKSVSRDDIIIIDANLDIPSIHYIARNAQCILAADPVSVAKSARLADVLDRLTVFKPNRFEAEHMSGIEITDEDSMRRVLDWFLEQGVKETVISMAEKGILLGTAEEKILLSHRIVDIENATGGGDSFLAAYTSARNRGDTPREAVRFAASCAVCVIEKKAAQRRQITRQAVMENERGMQIKEKLL